MAPQIEFVAFTLVPGTVLVAVILYSTVEIYDLGDYRPILLVSLLVFMTLHQVTEVLQYTAGVFDRTVSPTAEAYESGANLLASAASYLIIRRMDELSTTRGELERSNAALQERSSMVSVLNRILRHNVRNDVNIIAGQAEHIKLRSDDDRFREELETIETTAWELATISERTQRIRQLLTEDSTDATTIRLDEQLDASLDRIRRSTRGVTVTFENTSEGGVTVNGTSTLSRAIVDVVERIILSNDGAVRIEITIARDADGSNQGRESAVIRIDDDGDGVPELDVRAIESGEETPLRHAEGLELWCLEWAVKRAGGELDAEPADGTIEIRLPIAAR